MNNADAEPQGASHQAKSGAAARLQRGRPVAFLLVGLIAGLLGWGLMRFGNVFDMPAELMARLAEVRSPVPPAELQAELEAARRTIEYQNSSIAFALFAAGAAGLLGLFAGVLNRSLRRGAIGLAAGIVAGAGFGALGGLAAVFVGEQLSEIKGLDPTYIGMSQQAVALLLAGLAIGTAVGVATGEAKALVRSTVAAAIAGLFAALLYPAGAAFLFPIDNASRLIPVEGWNRLFWSLLACGLMGVAAGGVAGRRFRP